VNGRFAARRRLAPPTDVAARLDLVPGQRPLAWALGAQGRWYVGTDRALHLADGDGFRKVAWEEIERADWKSAPTGRAKRGGSSSRWRAGESPKPACISPSSNPGGCSSCCASG
jgi:hypothetical protein